MVADEPSSREEELPNVNNDNETSLHPHLRLEGVLMTPTNGAQQSGTSSGNKRMLMLPWVQLWVPILIKEATLWDFHQRLGKALAWFLIALTLNIDLRQPKIALVRPYSTMKLSFILWRAKTLNLKPFWHFCYTLGPSRLGLNWFEWFAL